jgi:hypothetical protein
MTINDKIEGLSKQDLIRLVKKIVKRCRKIKEKSPYNGPPSQTFCGKKRNNVNQIRKGTRVECLKKGIGVGNANGEIKGVNKERNNIIKLVRNF